MAIKPLCHVQWLAERLPFQSSSPLHSYIRLMVSR